MKRIVNVLALLFCFMLGVSADALLRLSRATPAPAPALRGRGKVLLVPLGDFPPSKLRELSAHFREKYGLAVGVLPPVPLDSSAFNGERQQFVAERLIESMKRGRPEQARDPYAILIGVTAEDIYIDSRDWRFAFGLMRGRFAVLSDARMRLDAPAGRAESRLRKMLTKYVGVIHYGLETSGDPRSVLYNNILGPDDLDRMGEEF